jgi:hypothetical protein
MKKEFRIDLTEIEGDGEFRCPTCGIMISPDDYSKMIYEILDIKRGKDGAVEEAYLQCRRCRSIICLDGFDLLESTGCFVSEEHALLSKLGFLS